MRRSRSFRSWCRRARYFGTVKWTGRNIELGEFFNLLLAANTPSSRKDDRGKSVVLIGVIRRQCRARQNRRWRWLRLLLGLMLTLGYVSGRRGINLNLSMLRSRDRRRPSLAPDSLPRPLASRTNRQGRIHRCSQSHFQIRSKHHREGESGLLLPRFASRRWRWGSVS